MTSKTGKMYLYDSVYVTLKNEILGGVYQPDDSLPSEREISLRFDVDRATVRKSLSYLVKDGLIDKRAGARTKVIYGKNTAASMITSNLIGFFIIENASTSKRSRQPLYSDVLYQIEIASKQYEATILFSTVNSESAFINMISQHQFKGIVFASKTENSYIELAEKAGIKTVQIFGYISTGLTICNDNLSSGILAITHLIENGHKKIAFITGSDDYQSSKSRFVGGWSTLLSNHIQLPDEYVIEGDWEYESGYESALKLLNLGKKRPTAIYAFNDIMALGAIDAITASGFNVPADISIISTDNMSQLRTLDKKLTTTDSNIETIAKIALDYFYNSTMEIKDMHGIKIEVPVTLIKGDTVRDISKNSERNER